MVVVVGGWSCILILRASLLVSGTWYMLKADLPCVVRGRSGPFGKTRSGQPDELYTEWLPHRLQSILSLAIVVIHFPLLIYHSSFDRKRG